MEEDTLSREGRGVLEFSYRRGHMELCTPDINPLNEGECAENLVCSVCMLPGCGDKAGKTVCQRYNPFSE
jgi:hypothetical protein